MDLIILCIASREEYIFQLQVIEAQIYYLNMTEKLKIVQGIQYKLIKVEQRRLQLEQKALLQYNEPRKMLLKLVKRYIKIQGYYYSKLQLYFPLYSQKKQLLPTPRNVLFKIASNPDKSCQQIIQIFQSIQKEKMFKQMETLIKNTPRHDYVAQMFDQITNKNEKFCQDALNNVDQLNHIHLNYYLVDQSDIKQDPYDVLNLEDLSKDVYSGAFFRSYVSCLTKVKNVFIPIETTQEILFFRFDKLNKQIQDQNNQLGKRILKYIYKTLNHIHPSFHKKSSSNIFQRPQTKSRSIRGGRFSRQDESRQSYTFQDGYLTEKDNHFEIQSQAMERPSIVSAKNNNMRIQLSRQYLMTSQGNYRVNESIPLMMCGKSLKFSNSQYEQEKQKLNEKINLSHIVLSKNVKLQKQGLTQKYQLISIAKNCSQMKLKL